jgi:hypothetical protein
MMKDLLSQIANPENLGKRKNLRLVGAVGVVLAKTHRWNIDPKHRLLKLLLIVKIPMLERMKKILWIIHMIKRHKKLSLLTSQVRLESL